MRLRVAFASIPRGRPSRQQTRMIGDTVSVKPPGNYTFYPSLILGGTFKIRSVVEHEFVWT